MALAVESCPASSMSRTRMRVGKGATREGREEDEDDYSITESLTHGESSAGQDNQSYSGDLGRR